MRAEGAADTFRISIVRELILSNLIRIWSNARDRILLNRHQRIALLRAADHRRRKLLGPCEIATGLLADELPEALNVLPQVAHHKVRSIPADVSLLRCIFRGKQPSARGIGIDQRSIGVFAVFIAIPEEKLAKRNDVAVVKLTSQHVALLLPIDFRLADTILETERFEPIKI